MKLAIIEPATADDDRELEIQVDKCLIESIDTFIRDNYGKTTLSGYLIDDDAGVIIWPYDAVGTDILIKFILEQELVLDG